MTALPAGGVAYRADPQAATVVFGLAGGLNSGRVLTVLDENGKFVGDLPKWSVFTVPVSPGPHMFVLVEFDHRETDVVFADVRAGSIYYVDVIDGIHPLTNRRRPYFWPSRLGGDPTYTLSTLPEHLEKCAWLKPDAEAGNRFLAANAADIQEVMKDANEEKKAIQGAGLAALHSFGPNDALRP